MVRFSRLFGTAAIVVSLVVVSAFAESSSGSAKPQIIRDLGCIFFDANGTEFIDGAAEIQIIYTNTQSGAYAITCRGELPEGAVLPTEVMHWDPADKSEYACQPGAEVDEWRMTIFPSGTARFTCHGKF